MAKSLQVTVTNPDDLNTLQGELVTKNYNLEILGLKNPADFRKFSKSLMMLDRILKETNDKVDNGLKTKLDKGGYSGTAKDLKNEIDGKVSKSGDKLNGTLSINTSGMNQIKILHNDIVVGELVANSEAISLFNSTSSNFAALYNNGNATIKANNLKTSAKEVIDAINELDYGKFNNTGGVLSGDIIVKTSRQPMFGLDIGEKHKGGLYAEDSAVIVWNSAGRNFIHLYDNGETTITAKNLKTKSKEVVGAIGELHDEKLSKNGDTMTGPLAIDAWNNNLRLLSRGVNKGEVIAVEDGVAIWNASSRNKLMLRNDGWLLATANNLTTKSKDIVAAINELKNRFNNPSILWENNSSSDVSELVATGLSKYRIIMMKYVLGKATHSSQVGPDIHTEMVYITDDNPNFHINGFGSSRVRYNINGDTLTRTFKDNTSFVLRRVYGLIEK